jgi:UDPglucose 6-dehydrogenase
MQIAILGAGYVGLVSAACLADLGHHVTCIDINRDRIEGLQRGEIPIYEPGLESIVERNIGNGHLRFAPDTAGALATAQVVFICVGTPPRPQDGEADLGFVFEAARDIARYARDDVVVVTKSTVPVGTGDLIEGLIRRRRPHLHFGVTSNPEFLKEGAAVADFMRPDRIVIGAEDGWAGDRVAQLYAELARAGTPILRTRRRSSEAIKYAANAFLAIKLSFINEVADFCEAWDADIDSVSAGIGLDRRIGPDFLQPGPGYGGSCFPKDLRALLHSARERAVGLRMVETASAVNEARKWSMGRRIAAAVPGGLHDARVALLGLAFKAETDDVRESPALAVVNALLRDGAHLHVHDPKGMKAARGLIEGVTFAETVRDCLRDAEILVIATGWEEYARLDPHAVAGLMAGRLVFDLRNALPATSWRKAGFTLRRIGEADPPASISFTARPGPYRPERPANGGDVIRHERRPERGTGAAGSVSLMKPVE